MQKPLFEKDEPTEKNLQIRISLPLLQTLYYGRKIVDVSAKLQHLQI